MKKLSLLLAAAFCLLLSCKKNDMNHPSNAGLLPEETKKDAFDLENEHLKIAVVSDIHYTDPGLFTNNGMNGAAFQAYLAQDPKLLAYSDPIFRRVLADLEADLPDILLVPGDLTKDGERMSHESVAAFLQGLQNRNVKVYVVPGNHDVANPEAARYDGDNAFPTPSISPADFGTIYAGFGYGNALYRDPNSLSYVAQPYPGLWIMGIDACRYEDNTTKSTTPGRIKTQTLNWMLARLAEANSQGIAVFGMMHHNLLEHYTNQSVLDPGYVIEDWQSVSETLLNAGLHIVFTGHYHASDITRLEKNGKELYDIETGSLVTAPIPYRRIVMKNKNLDITTTRVQSVNAVFPGNVSLPQYANTFLSGHLDNYFSQLLVGPPFNAPSDLAVYAAPTFRQGIMAHLAGDEKITPQQQSEVAQLAQLAPPLADIVNILWTDLPVADNRETVRYRY